MKTKLYHTSGTKFKVGDVIGGPGLTVFMTTSPVPHGTIQDIVETGYASYNEYITAYLKHNDDFYDALDAWAVTREGTKPEYKKLSNPKPVDLTVYEVRPYEKPRWVNINREYRADDTFVEIVRIVGDAKGILQNHKRKFGDTSKAWFFGSNAIRSVKNT